MYSLFNRDRIKVRESNMVKIGARISKYLKLEYKSISMFFQFSFELLLSRGEFEETIAPFR